MINPKKVADNFSKSAETYENNAHFQSEAADRLMSTVSKLMAGHKPPKRILEIGCGTGFLTRQLLKQFPGSKFVVTDISTNMLDRCERGTSNIVERLSIDVKYEYLDINDGPPHGQFDLVVSGLTFQWLDNLEQVMESIQDGMTFDGKLVFTTLLDSTFSTIRHAFEKLGVRYPGATFLTKRELNACCSLFRHVEIVESTHEDEYESILDFLRHIRLTGTGNPGHPLSPKELRRVIRHFNDDHILGNYHLAVVACDV